MPRRLPLVNKLPAHLGDGLLIIALLNVSVFLFFFFAFFVLESHVFRTLYYDWLALSVPAVFSGRVWTLFTYGFLHDMDSLTHIVFNMLGLYFLGPHIERHFGRRGFLRFWVVTVIGGGILAFLASLISGNSVVVVGSSAGVVALIGAWSWIYPNLELRLMLLIPIRSRWLVYVAVGFDVIAKMIGSDVAIWAHFGGLLAAWLLIHGWLRPEHLKQRFGRSNRKARQRRRGFRVIDGDDDDEPTINRGLGEPAV